MTFNRKMTVRMYDTDAAGILYFANQFRFIHDTFEEWITSHGWGFDRLFDDSPYTFVIVHAESDYLHSITVGDVLDIQLSVDRIGDTSFTMKYDLFKGDIKVGLVKTVHVVLDKKTKQKCSIPDELKNAFGVH